MSDDLLRKQGEEIVQLLSMLMRRLFTLGADDDPAMEIPGAQMRVCGILRDGPRTMSCLSSELGISQSAMTQIADRLERAGLVERVQESDDRRCKRLALTARGVEIMQARRGRRVLRTMEALSALEPVSRDAAVAALTALLDASTATVEQPSDCTATPEQLVS